MRSTRISSDLEIEALASQTLKDYSLYQLPIDIFQLAKILEINFSFKSQLSTSSRMLFIANS